MTNQNIDKYICRTWGTWNIGTRGSKGYYVQLINLQGTTVHANSSVLNCILLYLNIEELVPFFRALSLEHS